MQGVAVERSGCVSSRLHRPAFPAWLACCLADITKNKVFSPDYARHAVPVNEHVPVREPFRGEYGERIVILLIAWIIGYAGLV
jgi:hypothetical protein